MREGTSLMGNEGSSLNIPIATVFHSNYCYFVQNQTLVFNDNVFWQLGSAVPKGWISTPPDYSPDIFILVKSEF